MDKKIFTGAGCNAASVLTAISKAMDSPSKTTLPAGATWPFVTLSLSDTSVDFQMMHIKKNATPTDAKVVLSKIGYLYFQSPSHTNDFGFLTLRIDTLLKELRKRGYHLDESCERNKPIARASVIIMSVVSLAIVTLVTTMAILKPAGV